MCATADGDVYGDRDLYDVPGYPDRVVICTMCYIVSILIWLMCQIVI